MSRIKSTAKRRCCRSRPAAILARCAARRPPEGPDEVQLRGEPAVVCHVGNRSPCNQKRFRELQPQLSDEAARRLSCRCLEHARKMKPAQRGGGGEFLDAYLFCQIGLDVFDDALQAPLVETLRSACNGKGIEVETRIIVEQPHRESVSQRLDQKIPARRFDPQFPEYFRGDGSQLADRESLRRFSPTLR